MDLFDAHNHLQDERLADRLDDAMERAAAAGVRRMVCCGAAEDDWDRVAAIAGRWPDCVVPAYGLHPWYAGSRGPGWFGNLSDRLRRDGGALVGEIGLDHGIEPRDDAAQEDVFLAQMKLSRDLRRPVEIHGRRAWGRLLDLLRTEGPHPAGMIFHSYSGGAELVPELASLNGYFSFSGSLTLTNNKRSRRAAAVVPEDRLLIETDAPDIPPLALRTSTPEGQTTVNEPCHLVLTLAALAEIRGWTAACAAERTTANAERLLRGCGRDGG